jgi:hypothetical protein
VIQDRFNTSVPRAIVPEKSIHASRALREMIARPKISRNEWKTAERGASKVGNSAQVPSRLFWIERFGRFSSEVPWAQFTASVVDEFGEQPRGSLELLKPALGVRDAAGFVSMAAFGRFAEHRGRGGGFYGAFVALSDPARVVYAMGTVDDDAQGGEPAPALVEGLLGVAVAAVCCGGQHAAVLTAAGEVYTWGRGGFGRLGHGDAHSLKAPRLVPGRRKRATFPTSKAHISAVFHSFRLIFGRAIVSRNGLDAWMLFPERARAAHSR